jgi:hypothetical protein
MEALEAALANAEVDVDRALEVLTAAHPEGFSVVRAGEIVSRSGEPTQRRQAWRQ